uniref:Uncharacterized protein n=1 Tax=Anguilla anguilla TaxID=7936 RepID=A0A0E9WNN9_ANGAN
MKVHRGCVYGEKQSRIKTSLVVLYGSSHNTELMATWPNKSVPLLSPLLTITLF